MQGHPNSYCLVLMFMYFAVQRCQGLKQCKEIQLFTPTHFCFPGCVLVLLVSNAILLNMKLHGKQIREASLWFIWILAVNQEVFCIKMLSWAQYFCISVPSTKCIICCIQRSSPFSIASRRIKSTVLAIHSKPVLKQFSILQNVRTQRILPVWTVSWRA